MATSEATGTRGAVLRRIADARGAPVVHRRSRQLAAMAAAPAEPEADADDEWIALLRAVHAMLARDWPAVIVPVSARSLQAPGFADRLDDLADHHALRAGRIWLEADAAESLLDAPEVSEQLAQGHLVGVRLDVARGFRERALLPDLAGLGVSFARVEPADGRTVADDLSGLIVGRSLVRRAQAHGMAVIAPQELDGDMVPPDTR